MLTTRPPVAADRNMLLDWRNAPRVRGVSTNDRAITADEHAAWFGRLVADRSDQLVVVEWAGEPVGVVQLEALDLAARVSSWGCHLGRFDVPPGVGAALPMVGLGLGFGRFRLRRMTAVVLGHNRNMRSMHRRLGIVEEGVRREDVERADGSTVDAHEYGVLAREWPDVRAQGVALIPSAVRAPLETVLDSFA